jgi:hypothetical protein
MIWETYHGRGSVKVRDSILLQKPPNFLVINLSETIMGSSGTDNRPRERPSCGMEEWEDCKVFRTTAGHD